LALATTAHGGGKHQGLSAMYAAKMKGYTNSTAVRWTETLRLSPMEGVTHSPFSVLHSKIGITTIFNGCSIPHDAKPRPHGEEGARAWRKELMRGRTSSRQSSCREEGAHGGARAGKKELMEELARTASPNNGRQQRSWLGEEIVRGRLELCWPAQGSSEVANTTRSTFGVWT
jgi:hypothetical protein